MSRDWVCWAGLCCGVMAGCSGGDAPQPALPALSISQPPQPVPAASTKAASLLNQGDLQAALAQASRGIQAASQSAQAYETRAAVHHKLGQFNEALADFSKAIELDASSARLLNNRGFLLLSLERYDAALTDLDAAIKLAPTYANAHNNRGLLQIAQGRYRQAVIDLDRALQADPNYVDAYNNRGFAQMQLARWDRALADFNRALSLDPKGANALANRGVVKQNMGDATGAIVDFTEAMLLEPDNPKYYLHRREAYLIQGEFDQAQADAQKVVVLQELFSLKTRIAAAPKSPEPYLARGRFFQNRKDTSRALDDFTKAVELAPERDDVRLELAALLRDTNDLAAAMKECDTVLARSSDQRAFSIRGDCRMQLEDLDGALADFEAAKRLDNTVAEAYFLKGQALSRSGDSAGAQHYLSQAESLNPDIKAQQR